MPMSQTEKNSRHRQKHMSLGLCTRCKNPARPNKQLCETHAMENTANVRKWREARIATGQCLRCPKPAVNGLSRCEECARKHSDYQHAKSGRESPPRPYQKRSRPAFERPQVVPQLEVSKIEQEYIFPPVVIERPSFHSAAAEPTKAPPGTEEKILVLIDRYENGQEMHHPDDQRFDGLVGVPTNHELAYQADEKRPKRLRRKTGRYVTKPIAFDAQVGLP